MVVKMRYNGLIFVGLSAEQVEAVLYHADGCSIVRDESGGVQVNGSKQKLYDVLYNLSVIYDLELI